MRQDTIAITGRPGPPPSLGTEGDWTMRDAFALGLVVTVFLGGAGLVAYSFNLSDGIQASGTQEPRYFLSTGFVLLALAGLAWPRAKNGKALSPGTVLLVLTAAAGAIISFLQNGGMDHAHYLLIPVFLLPWKGWSRFSLRDSFRPLYLALGLTVCTLFLTPLLAIVFFLPAVMLFLYSRRSLEKETVPPRSTAPQTPASEPAPRAYAGRVALGLALTGFAGWCFARVATNLNPSDLIQDPGIPLLMALLLFAAGALMLYFWKHHAGPENQPSLPREPGT